MQRSRIFNANTNTSTSFCYHNFLNTGITALGSIVASLSGRQALQSLYLHTNGQLQAIAQAGVRI